jgi:prepilin-type N-terminal cleavage/methylation domain-containing protein
MFLPQKIRSIDRQLRQGFTLIELMVVVAIIGLLLAAGVASFTQVQKTARDGRRQQDIKAFQDALEQYRNTTGAYPTAATTAIIGPYFTTATIPVMPTGGTLVTGGPAAYTYTTSATNDKYCVCSGIENAAKGDATGNAAGVCTYVTTSQTMYCLSSQQ